MRRLVAITISAVFLLAQLSAPAVSAKNVQVTAGVGDTTIRISGWTAPFAFVTFMENSVVVGTTTADADGRYILLLVGQTPGIHNFRIFSRDSRGRTTKAVTTQLSAAEHAETAVSVFLPPAVSTRDDGGSVIIEGSTVPGATVVLTVGGKHFTAKADGAGNWHYVIAAGDLPASEYHISVAAILPGGLQSHIAGIPSVSIPPRGYVPPAPKPGARSGTFWIGTSMLPAPDGEVPSCPGERPDAPEKLPAGKEWVEKSAESSAGGSSTLLLALLWILVIAALWWLLASRRHERDGDDT